MTEINEETIENLEEQEDSVPAVFLRKVDVIIQNGEGDLIVIKANDKLATAE